VFAKSEMETSVTNQDRKKLATSFIEALRSGDANGFRTIMTDDVVWTLPGTSQVSGVAKGVEGILKRARTIVAYGTELEVQHVVLGHEGVALLLHNTGNQCTLRDEKIARLDTYISDIEMVNTYFA
jgi:ketosteroid isomerase-like protein